MKGLASPSRGLLADLLHDRRVRAHGLRLGELAFGEGALQGVVLVLDLFQLEVLPAWGLRGLEKIERKLRKAARNMQC